MTGMILTGVVAVVHFYFMYLEMVKWEAPRTRKAFGTTAEFAKATTVLAANQGLYNGFIAGGLVMSLVTGSVAMQVYLLCCVAVAGLYAFAGGIRAAVVFQTIPALVALVAVWVML